MHRTWAAHPPDSEHPSGPDAAATVPDLLKNRTCGPIYQSRRTDPAFLKKRIKEICETHVRYGYRRVFYILRRDGWAVGHDQGLSALQRVGATTTQQDAQAAGQGEATRGSRAALPPENWTISG